MNQQQLKAYLDLIQELLSCPRGEEWILLRQNERLVNGTLVEVMEQVANHLAIEGNIRAAKYLHNWAGKLHHILTENVPLPQKDKDKTQAYIELIQTLLNCPEGAEQSILEANQDLIGPELVKVMKQIANQLEAEGNESTASFLSNLATDLNRTWLKTHEFEPTFKKEIAPDPWFDEDTAAPDLSAATQPTALKTPQTETSETSTTSSLQTQIEPEQQLIPQLKAIAEALVRLETTLTSRLQPFNPLWYMDILEKAAAADWLLTTEEVEHLIGVKPHCNHDETTYYRGSWAFIKAGKIGAQTSWKVKKQIDSVS